MIETKIKKVDELESAFAILEKKNTNRKKNVFIISEDFMLEDEVSSIVKNKNFSFTTIYDKIEIKNKDLKAKNPSVILIDYDTIDDITKVTYELKGIFHLTPIILISKKKINLDNIIFENMFFFSVVSEITKNPNQLKVAIDNASRSNLTGLIIEKNSNLLDDFMRKGSQKKLNSVESVIYNIVSQIQSFSKLDNDQTSIDFIVIKNTISNNDRKIIGNSENYEILNRKKRNKLPKNLDDIISKTIIEKDNLKTEMFQSYYFQSSSKYETIFVFKNLSDLTFTSQRIFNYVIYNSSLLLTKIYEIEDQEKESIENIKNINELLKGENIDKELEILKDLCEICDLNYYQKEQIFKVFNIYDLEKTLRPFKEKSGKQNEYILNFKNRSLINLVNEISENIKNYKPKNHTIHKPTLYTDLIRLVYILKTNEFSYVLKNRKTFKIPNYICKKFITKIKK